MPAHPAALARAGLELPADQFLNSGPVEDARLWFLGDVFPLPGPDWLHTVFSVGDVLLFAGIFIVVHSLSNSRLAPHLPGYRPPEAEPSRLAEVMAMMDATPIEPARLSPTPSEWPVPIELLSGPPRS